MEAFIGTILIWPISFAPNGWAFCNGQLLNISGNTTLFALLGTTYGGDGVTTFALPDLRGRVPVGVGQGSGLSSYVLGQQAGTETVTLTTAQMPSHTHTATATLRGLNGLANQIVPAGNTLAVATSNQYSTNAPNVDMNNNSIDATIAEAGSGQAHENRQPSLALNYIICLQGIFPSQF